MTEPNEERCVKCGRVRNQPMTRDTCVGFGCVFPDPPAPVAEKCGSKDPVSPRICDREIGHDGVHDDSTLPIGATERIVAPVADAEPERERKQRRFAAAPKGGAR